MMEQSHSVRCMGLGFADALVRCRVVIAMLANQNMCLPVFNRFAHPPQPTRILLLVHVVVVVLLVFCCPILHSSPLYGLGHTPLYFSYSVCSVCVTLFVKITSLLLWTGVYCCACCAPGDVLLVGSKCKRSSGYLDNRWQN